jgi:6-carboxyhexanoate--CoA ligase
MDNLFSIKIRSSKEGKHISGSERIVRKEKINETVLKLLERQKDKDYDFSNIKVEKIKEIPIFVEKALRIKTIKFDSYIKAKDFAVKTLSKILNKDESWIKNFIDKLYEGAAPDKSNMRGAMLLNLKGERVEKDSFKGIRTVLVDYTDREKIEEKLLKKGYTKRTADALALTTKNMLHEDIIAEFCISDDPDYTTGYISTKEYYMRLTPLKPYGLEKGGRIYFLKENADIEDIYKFLTEKPVLIGDVDI